MRLSVSSRNLIHQCKQHARENDLCTLLAETNMDWYEAISLYQAHGFREYERDEESVHLRLSL